MSHLPHFELHQPRSLVELLETVASLAGKPGSVARILAGGTDLVPRLRAGRVAVDHLISLNRVAELATIAVGSGGELIIGAGARIRDVADHSAVRESYPALRTACTTMATVQIRNMGTIAGNVGNASPCADTACPLLVHGARVQVQSRARKRELELHERFAGPGQTTLAPDEIITAVVVPKPPAESGAAYIRHSARSEVDMAAASAAAQLIVTPRSDGGVRRITGARIALGAVAPTPVRCPDAESELVGSEPTETNLAAAAGTALRAAQPIDDVRASAAYRNAVTPVLVRRALQQAAELATGGSR